MNQQHAALHAALDAIAQRAYKADPPKCPKCDYVAPRGGFVVRAV